MSRTTATSIAIYSAVAASTAIAVRHAPLASLTLRRRMTAEAAAILEFNRTPKDLVDAGLVLQRWDGARRSIYPVELPKAQ